MVRSRIFAVALTSVLLGACSVDLSSYLGTKPAAPPPPQVPSLGPSVGSLLGDDDRQRANAAQLQALQYGEPGAPVGWRNPDTGRYGNIVPGPSYESNGATCRQFSHTFYVDGRPQIARGTACRKPDGNWTVG